MRIHVENELNGAPELVLSEARLARRLSEAGIAAEISIGASADFAAMMPDCDVLLSCRKPDLAKARAQAPSLKWTQVISAGVEAFLPGLPEDMALTNASGVHGEKGAEFVLTAALMLCYGIPAFVDDRAARVWSPRFHTPARGKRVTLLGVGGIGAPAARLLMRQGFAVTGVTRSGQCAVEGMACCGLDALEALLPQTDILISTLPLTPQTRGMMDARRLALLPIGAGVVVVGRAAVFDYDALRLALEGTHLGGAVLDVFPVEPLPDYDPLWQAPRLILTPHCSVDDHATYLEGCLDIFLANLRRFRDGEPLHNRVDPKLGY